MLNAILDYLLGVLGVVEKNKFLTKGEVYNEHNKPATAKIWARDLLITSQALHQLSYSCSAHYLLSYSGISDI